MKLTEKQKVINRIAKGAGVENATKWVNEHYDYAEKHYTGVAKISEVIMSL